MRALTFTGPDELEWREAPDARLGGDGEAVVRPLAVATCDLEELIVRGRSPFPPPFVIFQSMASTSSPSQAHGAKWTSASRSMQQLAAVEPATWT